MLAHKKGYSLIITVDNGIKSTQALALAKELGMDVIVTDHHTMDEEVNCDIVVHPDLMETCFETLCGAGVAYECMRVLGVDNDYTAGRPCEYFRYDDCERADACFDSKCVTFDESNA